MSTFTPHNSALPGPFLGIPIDALVAKHEECCCLIVLESCESVCCCYVCLESLFLLSSLLVVYDMLVVYVECRVSTIADVSL